MADAGKQSHACQDEQIVQQLAWKMLDETIDEEEAEHLALLLTHSDTARKTYVRIVQLHADLLSRFGQLPSAEDLLKDVASASTAQAAPAPPLPETPTTAPTGL